MVKNSAFLLIACMSIAALPATAFAQSAQSRATDKAVETNVSQALAQKQAQKQAQRKAALHTPAPVAQAVAPAQPKADAPSQPAKN